jgi:hypothetical protein
MLSVKADFVKRADLTDLVDWLSPVLHEMNWLFVALDSTRGDFGAVEKHLSPELKRNNITFWWGDGGLWLPGEELIKSFIVVPFSACYIFEREVKSCAKPSFNTTTDMGEPFADDEVKAVFNEITKLKALCYAADGCGLQYVSLDEKLGFLIEKGKQGDGLNR